MHSSVDRVVREVRKVANVLTGRMLRRVGKLAVKACMAGQKR